MCLARRKAGISRGCPPCGQIEMGRGTGALRYHFCLSICRAWSFFSVLDVGILSTFLLLPGKFLYPGLHVIILFKYN